MYMLTYITGNSKSKSSTVSCFLCILLVVLGGQEGSFHVEGVSGSASITLSKFKSYIPFYLTLFTRLLTKSLSSIFVIPKLFLPASLIEAPI